MHIACPPRAFILSRLLHMGKTVIFTRQSSRHSITCEADFDWLVDGSYALAALTFPVIHGRIASVAGGEQGVRIARAVCTQPGERQRTGLQ